MTFRLPQSLTGGHRPETGWNVLGHEIAQQKAEVLGDIGRQVEQALAALRGFDEKAADSTGPARADLVDAAADRAWAFMIQRELCGLRHWDAVVRNLGIPREVLNRMGRVRR